MERVLALPGPLRSVYMLDPGDSYLMSAIPSRHSLPKQSRIFGSRLFIACLCICTQFIAFDSAQAADSPTEPVAIPFGIDPNPSAYQPFPRDDVLISGATVLDGKGGRFSNMDVLVQDGRIIRVEEGIVVPDKVDVIDAAGQWLTPGIIDIHSHNGTYVLPLTSQNFAISDVSEISDPNTAQIWIENGIDVQDLTFGRALAAGVTTLQVVPGSVPLFGGRSVVLKPIPAQTIYQMKFPGAQQGMKMACGENPKSHFGELGKAPTSRMGEIAAMKEAFLSASAYLSGWESYLQNPGVVDQPKRDLALDSLAGVLNGDLRVHLHCYRADDIAVMLALAKEFGFQIAAIHHATEGYKITDLLQQSGVCAAVWSDWWGYKMEASDAIRENAAMLDSAGVCTIMHSDSPVVGQRLNIEASKAMGAGRRAGIEIPPEQAIRWLTSNPALALGLESRIGTIDPGFNADLVVWSGDPFSIYSRVERVYIDGALLYLRSETTPQPPSDKEIGFPVLEVRP
jgi:imidazolonepropionase-like amidohydrolase